MITIELRVKKQTLTAHRFCRYLIKWIKRDFRSKRNCDALQLRLDLLGIMPFVTWSSSNHNISADSFIDQLCNCVEYTVRKNNFIIYINTAKLLRGTLNTVEQITRYVDYGTTIVPGSMMFTGILSKYQRNLDKYWLAYKIQTQSR